MLGNSEHKTHLAVAFVILKLFVSTSFSQIAAPKPTNELDKAVKASLEGRIFTLRQQPNHSGVLYLNFGSNDYICRIESGPLFPLSSDLDGVKVVAVKKSIETEVLRRVSSAPPKAGSRSADTGDVVVEHNLLKLQLRHQSLGKCNLFISRGSGAPVDSANDVFAALGYVLKGEPLPEAMMYSVGPGAKFTHYVASGHASAGSEIKLFATPEDAVAKGYHICPICVNKLMRLPMLLTEIAIGREVEAAVRHNDRLFNSTEMHDRISRIGQTVVSNWPTRLKGYDYRFSVLDNKDINAFACPGGYIFVNRGLIEAAENDDELEAVLAHEIAHVEQRHGLMEYVKAQRDNRNAMIFASLVTVGIAAGAAVGGNQDAILIASAGGQVSVLLAAVAAQVASTGYSKQHEQEADIYALVYLQGRGKTKAPLLSVLKKLRTCQDIESSLEGGKITSQTHPEIKDRLYAAETLEVQSFNGDRAFDAFEKDGDLLYNLTLHVQAKYQKRDGRESMLMLGEIATMAAIGESEQFNELRLSQGGSVSSFEADGMVKVGPLETHAVSFTKTGNGLKFISGDIVPAIVGVPAARVIHVTR